MLTDWQTLLESSCQAAERLETTCLKSSLMAAFHIMGCQMYSADMALLS
jgi:hypothetical protein